MDETDIKKTWVEVKDYLALHLDYGKLTAVEKLSVLLSAVALFAVLLVICIFVIFIIALGLVLWLANALGSYWIALLLVAVILLGLMAMVFYMRKQWITDPVTRFVTRLFLTPDDLDNEKKRNT